MKQVLIQLEKCLGCKSCEIACAVEHSASRELIGAFLEKDRPRPRIQVETNGTLNFPIQCRHCADPQCVKACMTGALTLDAESGTVQQHKEKCVGCWMCVMVCPFGAISEDWQQKKAVKCDLCQDRDMPACVAACPTKALRFVDVHTYGKEARQRYISNFIMAEEG